jgi:hypothetical protein
MALPQLTLPLESATPRSTRQILDELDALMDQMLALPVVEDPKAPASPAISATLTFLEPEPIAVAPTPIPVEIPIRRVEWTPPPAVIDDALEVDLEPLDAEFDPIDVEIVSEADVVAPPAKGPMPQPMFWKTSPTSDFTPAPRPTSGPLPPSQAPWFLRTAILWDRGFRRLTRGFGFLGWLARSSFGRGVLGLAGFALWLVAIAWLVRDSLQWPR